MFVKFVLVAMFRARGFYNSILLRLLIVQSRADRHDHITYTLLFPIPSMKLMLPSPYPPYISWSTSYRPWRYVLVSQLMLYHIYVFLLSNYVQRLSR